MNSFGTIYTLTTFGESHGPAIGGVIDGVPAGFPLDTEKIQQALDRRKPGNSTLTSPRREADRVQILSGIYNGLTLGSPIGFIIPNSDAHSSDYDEMQRLYRPNHADFTYDAKYGFRDPRGGGRASARETACRVVAGAIASQMLESHGIKINAYVSSIGHTSRPDAQSDIAPLLAEVEKARMAHDSIGGIVSCSIKGLPTGLGEPVYGKLHARMAEALMSIPGAKGFEYGAGFAAAKARGTEVLDEFIPGTNGGITTASNFSGGVQGGISNGAPLILRVAFKPTPTLPMELSTVDNQGRPATLKARGRHDPCIVLRAWPVVEAMAAMVTLDAILLHRCARW